MDLQEYLEKYRTLTLELINQVKNDGDMDSLFREREEILKAVNSIDFDKEEIKRIGNSLKLLELDEELKESIKNESIEVKQKIEMLKRSKQVNMNYTSIENKSRIFNKMI